MSNTAGRATLYTHADVVTLEPSQPHAGALAVADGRILHVGSDTDCRAALSAVNDVDEVNLGGRCIVPGFIDTHLHPIGLVYFDMNADLRPANSIASLQELLRRAASRLAPGEWLVGLQLEDEALLEHACFNTYAILIGGSVDAAIAARTSPLHDPSGGRRVGGFKIFADGTFGSCTAHMREPFADRPGERGITTLNQDEIFSRMRQAHAAGLQICVHAIGDAAIADCRALFEQLLAERPRTDHRHRIEHASLLTPDLIERIAQLGLCVSTQPLFIHSEKGWLDRRLGTRAQYAYPLRALLDAGATVGGASDAPVESLDVLHAIQCCVTREGFHPEQNISAGQALDLFTRNAAFLQFEENEKGSLAAGKRADLVVLSANPLTGPADRIGDIRVVRTVCNGRTTYDSEGARA